MKIAVYGSLKRGKYNHGRMGPQEFIGESVIGGYALYIHEMLPYPCVVPEDGAGVMVEVFEVTDRAFQMLDNMERGAGYAPVTVVTKYGPAIMWFKKSSEGWKKANRLEW